MNRIASFQDWRQALAAVALAAGLLAAAPARADLIVNGSFEATSLGGSTWAIFANGAVPGWTSSNNEIEIDKPGAIGLAAAYDGGQSVELNGNTFSTLSQTVTGLVAGQFYRITWAYSGRAGSGNQQMDVTFDGALVGRNTDTGAATLAWQAGAAIVRATGVTGVLRFAAINAGGSSSVGNELDGVTMAAVPEPLGLIAFLAGLAGLGAALRRSRSRHRRPSPTR